MIRNLLPSQLSTGTAIILAIVGLALIFAGRHIIRVIAFLAVGLVVAALGAAFGALILGIIGLLVGGFLGFIIGGILSLLLLPIAIGIGAGVIAFNMAQTLAHVYILSVVTGIVVFIIGIVLSAKLLSLATAGFGSLLLFNALVFFNIPYPIAALIALTLGVAGFFAQGGFRQRQGAKFVTTWTPRRSWGSMSSRGSRVCPNCGTRLPMSASGYCPNCGAKLP